MAQLTRHSCPNCGAKVSVRPEEPRVVCQYCGEDYANPNLKADSQNRPAAPIPSPKQAAKPPAAAPTTVRWGIGSSLFFWIALLLLTGVCTAGWKVIGPYKDSEEAFALWVGVGPLLMIIAGSIWDSYARKLLAIFGVIGSTFIGFMLGMAIFEYEFFLRIINFGGYADDMAAFYALVAGANLVGLAIGLSIHHSVARSKARRQAGQA